MGRFFLVSAILLLSLNTFAQKKETLVESTIRSHESCHKHDFFWFCGSKHQRAQLKQWLTDILKTEIGKNILNDIKHSGHMMAIVHSSIAANSAGTTAAILTSDLTNGIGTPVVVKLNFDMPNSGSHLVRDINYQLVEFTAAQNLFHELSHARHKINGEWLYFDSEGQAISDENTFRQQLAVANGTTGFVRDRDSMDDDKQIWFPEKIPH